MFLRTASERDLPAVRELLVETRHATYDSIYGADNVTEITDEWHSIASLKTRLDRPNSEFLVADDGKLLGGMAYAAATSDPKIVILHQLYVRPRLQRRGLGGLLLREAGHRLLPRKRLRLAWRGGQLQGFDVRQSRCPLRKATFVRAISARH